MCSLVWIGPGDDDDDDDDDKDREAFLHDISKYHISDNKATYIWEYC